jgi:predicted ATPase/class 3 adenylate cyclase
MTDIESSTRLFRELGDDYVALLGTHHRLLSEAFERHGGVEVATEGDALVVAFPDAAGALRGCVEGQRALQSYSWPPGAAIRVRMGLHTAQAEPTGDNYVSLGLHQAARICAAAHGGQVLLSEATADQLRHHLPDGVALTLLGSFQLRGFAAPARLFEVRHPGLSAVFPPLRVQGVVNHNLPFHRSSFVGRVAERAALAEMVRRTGMVTVVGVGGVGKTRLAVQVAFDLLDDFDDGAWLVELASATDRRAVAGAVASVLGVTERPGRPLEDVVIDDLSAKAALLLLDNCEQVVEPAAVFTEELVRRCPHVVVIATSREELAVEGEVVCRLDPMPVPDLDVAGAAEAVPRGDAVQLFEQRAALARPGFRVTDANAADVGSIVRQLDGIPLAIELAAAALSDRSLGGVVTGLSDRFALLTYGRRAAPGRHQTLRAALEWSLDLLGEQERLLFARLGAFARSGGVDAVAEVCGLPPLSGADTSRLLRRLGRASLLAIGDDDRWTMLDSVHDLAALELSRTPDAEQVVERHRDWYTRRAEALGPQVGLRGRAGVMADLVADLDNVRTAIGTGVVGGDVERTLRLAAAMTPFWTSHGDWSGGIQLLRDALALDGGAAGARGRALAALGSLLILRGEMSPAEECLEQASALAAEAEDETTLARAASGRGYVAFRRSDLDRAEASWRDALVHADRAGDERVRPGILRSLAIAAGSRGDQVAAGELLDRGIRSAEHAEDDQLLRLMLGSRAEIALWTGRYAQARDLYGQALDLASTIGDLSARPLLLCELGWVALLRGELDTVDRLAAEAAELAEDLGNRRTRASALRLRAELLARRNRLAEAEAEVSRAREVADALADPAEVSGVLCTEAFVALEQGHFEEAQRLAASAIARTALGHGWRSFFPHWVMGASALAVGDLDEAERRFRAGVEHSTTEGSPRHQANSRWGLARVRAVSGHMGEAARLDREALTLRHQIGDRLGVVESLVGAAGVVAATDRAAARALVSAAQLLQADLGAEATPRQAEALAAVEAVLAAEPDEEARPPAVDESGAVALAIRLLEGLEQTDVPRAG